MIRLTKYGFLILAGIVLAACSKHVTEGGVKLHKKKDTELIQALDTLSGRSLNSFYSKISTNYQDTAQNVSFKTTLRIVSDTATTMMISYANIPFVNSLITADSVKVTNRKTKCYMRESLSFIKEKFSVDFTLKNIEELMTGLPVDFNAERDYFQTESLDGYELCTHSKKELKKIEKGELSEMVIYYKLSPDLKQLVSMTIVSPKDKTEITVNYKTRELIDSFLLPKQVEIRILTPAQEMKIEMEYKKSRVNGTEQIHFVIPDSYGECE